MYYIFYVNKKIPPLFTVKNISQRLGEIQNISDSIEYIISYYNKYVIPKIYGWLSKIKRTVNFAHFKYKILKNKYR